MANNLLTISMITNEAFRVSHDKPKGWLLSAQSGTPVSTTGKFIVQKIQAIPQPECRFTTIDFLKACFEPDETVCICNDIICDEEGKGRPASKGTFLKRDEWIEKHFTPPISSMCCRTRRTHRPRQSTWGFTRPTRPTPDLARR